MESLPARQQRRSSPTESSQPRSTSSPVRARSEDSQTIFVQKEEEEMEQAQQQELEEDQIPQILPQEASKPFSEEPAKCWICLLDATEDTPESTPWRSPCPCALTAHEACLLDWIADVEAPSKHPTTKPKVQCPQCKAEIHLSRPRDLLVDIYQVGERSISWSVPKAAIFVACGILYGACAASGMHTVYAVFGPDDGARILEPVTANTVRAPVDAYLGTPRETAERVLGVVKDHLVHWRLYVGLPLITPTLILSRTTFADGILPILPVLFFVANGQRGMIEGADILQWPPSAEFAFAVLPYVRGVYNAWYKRVWAERKKKWLRELQPRTGSGDDAQDGAANGIPAAQPEAAAVDGEGNDGGNFLEIRVEVEEDFEEGAFEEENFEQPGEGDAINLEEAAEGITHHLEEGAGDHVDFPQPQINLPPPAQEAEAAPPPVVPDNRQPFPGPLNARPDQQRDLLRIDTTHIGQSVLGALLFPTLSGLAGETLKLVLPTSWLVGRGSRRTFLEAKWARTLVGGCLLVLGKDALVLYVRWRMAKMQRSRSVLNYDRSKGRLV